MQKLEGDEEHCLEEVLEVIEQELYTIPKDDMIRCVISVVCVAVIFVWLLFIA